MSWRRVAVVLALVALILLILILPLVLRLRVGRQAADRIYPQVAEIPPQPVAIVFGAGVWSSGHLSHALADRMETAIDLYRAGKVNKLLLTGDNQTVDYNEPAAMAEYAQARGVPREDLVLDYAGRRTYDSCYRAKAIFGVERAVLVTQAFHLPRALYTCEGLGLEAVGVVADRRDYLREGWYEVREVAALTRAWLDLNLLRPVPILGEPIVVDWSRRVGSGS